MLLLAVTLLLGALVAALQVVFLLTLLVLIFKAHSIFGATAGSGLGIVFSFGIFAAATTVWSVALPIAVIERPGRLRALRRSRYLIRGNRMRTFVTLALISMIVVLSAAISRALLGNAVYAGVHASTLLSDVVLLPLPLLAITTIYLELRATADELAPAD